MTEDTAIDRISAGTVMPGGLPPDKSVDSYTTYVEIDGSIKTIVLEFGGETRRLDANLVWKRVIK